MAAQETRPTSAATGEEAARIAAVAAFVASADDNVAGLVIEDAAAEGGLCPVLKFDERVRFVLDLRKPTYFQTRRADGKARGDSPDDVCDAVLARLQMFLDYGPAPETSDVRAVLKHATQLFLHGAKNAEWDRARVAALRPRLEAECDALARRPVFARAPKDAADAATGALRSMLVANAVGATLDGFCRAPGVEEVQEALLLPGGAAGALWLAPGECTAAGKAACSCLHSLASGGAADGGVVADAQCALLQSVVLGVWGHRLQVEQLARAVAARFDVLRHRPAAQAAGVAALCGGADAKAGEDDEDERGKDVVSACACVASAVAYLVGNPSDPERHSHAYETARFVAESVVVSENARAACSSAAQLAQQADIERNPRQAAIPLLVFAPECAALCLALAHLLRRTQLVPTALQSTAAAGGGTAQSLRFALVGALLGAQNGAWCVPPALWEQVVACPLERYGKRVPADEQAAGTDDALAAVVTSAPTVLPK